MAKQNLLGDTVIRRDGIGRLYLMNRQEGGWKSSRVSVASEEAILNEYNVRLGEWTEDSCSQYCPVHAMTRSEMPTLHDGEDPDEVVEFRAVLDANPAEKASLISEQSAALSKDLVQVDGDVFQIDGYKLNHVLTPFSDTLPRVTLAMKS